MALRSNFCMAVFATCSIAVFQGCYYDNEEDLYPFAQPCDSIDPTYNNRIEAIIAAKCATSACHAGVAPSAGLWLDNYQQVRTIALNGKLTTRVIIQKNMPPSGPLPQCELEALQNWINAGAPE